MTQHTTIDATVRNAALRLLANGDATVAEVAELVETSRQRVQYWADQAGIDAVARRQVRLARFWAMGQADDALIARVTGRPVPKRKQP